MISSEGWVHPPELESIPKPRPVCTSKIGKTNMRIMLFLFCFMFLVFGSFSFWGWKRHQQFETVQRDGVVVQGAVAEKRYVGGKGSHYQVTYSYLVGTQKYQNSAPISSRDYHLISPGNPIELRYLPQHPEISRLTTERDDHPYKMFLILPFLNFISFGFLYKQMKKHKNLLSLGDPAKATVEKISKQKGSCLVSYRFQDQLGQEIRGKESVPYNRIPQIGETITILYLPTQPSQNVVYPPLMASLSDKIYS